MELGSNFVFFIGIVEDRGDPLMLGRVKVRCLNVHTFNKGDLPTEMLPWATPLQNITSAASATIGSAPVGLIVGSIVVGFFMDSEEKQMPIILGSLAGIPGGVPVNFSLSPGGKPNTSALLSDIPYPARGVQDYDNNFLETEPNSKFSEGAVYPYNQCLKTEAGHLIEWDNTPSKERVQIRHASGAYIQMDPAGNIVIKSVANLNILSANNRVDFVGANNTVIVKGALFIAVDNDIQIASDTSILLKAPRIDFKNS